MRAMIDLPLPAGLVAVVGDEGTGKTRCLRELAGWAPGQRARMPDASDPSWWPLRIGASYPQHGIRADFGVGDTSLFS